MGENHGVDEPINKQLSEAVEWVVFDASTATSDDPNGIGNGSPTMAGDYSQIPVDTNQNRGSRDDGYVLTLPLPADLELPGVDGVPRCVLLIEVDFGTAPTGDYGVCLGIVGAASNGAAAGSQRSGSNFIAYAAEGFGATQGSNGNSETTARGTVTVMGASGARKVDARSSVALSSAYESEDSTIADADLRLGLVIVHRTTASDAETLDVRARYKVIPYA